MTITNYFAAAIIAVAPSALMAGDYTLVPMPHEYHNYGAELSVGIRADEDSNSEVTVTSSVHLPVYGAFGVQTDLDFSENNEDFVQLGATIHGTYDVNDYVAVGAFYGQNGYNGASISHQGVEGSVDFGFMEVSGVAGLMEHQVEYYNIDGSFNVFTDYTAGLKFDHIQSLKTVTSVYASRSLGNDFDVEFRVQDVEDTQARTFGLTLTKSLGNGSKFKDAKPMIAPIS